VCNVCARREGKMVLVSEQLVGYFYGASLLDEERTIVRLSPDWRCVLRQPAASQVYLLRLTLARQIDLTLLDQGACSGNSL